MTCQACGQPVPDVMVAPGAIPFCVDCYGGAADVAHGLAVALPGTVEVLTIDPLGWIHVPCTDFDAFKPLPLAIQYHGRPYRRRGWNSDKHVAYYEPGLDGIARAVAP